mgnify:CR=1 FL=1
MSVCNCGKEYKLEKTFNKHLEECLYASMDLEKIYNLGYMINDVDKKLFHVSLAKIKKYSKDNNCDIDIAKKELQKDIMWNFWNYRILWYRQQEEPDMKISRQMVFIWRKVGMKLLPESWCGFWQIISGSILTKYSKSVSL